MGPQDRNGSGHLSYLGLEKDGHQVSAPRQSLLLRSRAHLFISAAHSQRGPRAPATVRALAVCAAVPLQAAHHGAKTHAVRNHTTCADGSVAEQGCQPHPCPPLNLCLSPWAHVSLSIFFCPGLLLCHPQVITASPSTSATVPLPVPLMLGGKLGTSQEPSQGPRPCASHSPKCLEKLKELKCFKHL